MPKDVSSSSSSEGEAETAPTKSPLKPKETGKKTPKYQCPSDFVPFCHKPCSSTLTARLKSKNNELWLIKAPVGFNPESFSGIKVPLSGLQTLKVPSAAGGATTGGGHQTYSVLASARGASELRLLTGDAHSSHGGAFGPAFSGLLNVCESYGDSSKNRAPQVVPAAPAPSVPPGLKQRFHPFGSKAPTLTCAPDSEVDGALVGPSSTTRRPLVVKRFLDDTERAEEEEEEGRRKRKKRKKDKRVKTEEEEEAAVNVKEEPVAGAQEEGMMEFPLKEGDVLEEKRKKKKKKKKEDRECEEVEERVEPSVRVKDEEVTVKCEPTDSWCGDVAERSGKKKKKKKSRRELE